MISVTIIEDDVELKDLWGEFLDSQRGFVCISSYTSCETALLKIKKDKPNVILMDIKLDGPMSGIDGVREIKKILPGTNILMVTVNEDENSLFDSLRAGADGYLVKNISLDDLLQNIIRVTNGGSPLSPGIDRKVVKSFGDKAAPEQLSLREIQVLRQLCNGKTQIMIADDLDIKLNTVKFHLKNIYKKLDVHNAAEAVSVGMRTGIV